MFHDDACLEKFAAMLIGASVAGVATAGVALTPGVAEALGAGAGLWARLSGQARGDADQVLRRMTAELRREWQDWGQLSSHADAGIRANAVASFEQVIGQCAALPAEVVGLRLSPEALAGRVLAKAAHALPQVYANPDPANPETHLPRQFLLRLTTRAYARLLAEPGYLDRLAPDLWRSMLGSLARIEADAARLVQQMERAVRELALKEGLVIGLARRIAAGVEDFDTALRELERSIGVAARMEREGALPSNSSDDVQRVLQEIARLNAAQHLDAAAEVVADAFDRIEAERARMIDIGIEQDILRRAPESAALWLVRKAGLAAQGNALFHALRTVWHDWYVRGRDMGLAFDLQVSIALGRHSQTIAETPDQRGMALNDLCTSLATLGEREPSTARLEEAVTFYHAALEERSRDRVPLDWAMTQSNLGVTLETLGQRETGTERLEEAVSAYRAALQEYTRARVPLDWATTQNNLGNALSTLGERETGTVRLKEAIIALRAALEERTRARVPLDWAATQNNLGSALHSLDTRESCTALLVEAVTAYRAAMEEYTRDRVPLNWAMTQHNLGNALTNLGEREPGTARLEEAVAAYRAALQERTLERVPLQWAMSHGNLGVALRLLADRSDDTLFAQTALTHLAEAQAVMRSSGHMPLADYYALQIPLAQALIARLSAPPGEPAP